MKSLKRVFVLLVFLVALSCGNDKGKVEPQIIEIDTTEKAVIYESSEVEVTFTNDTIAELFKQYISLKTAFVNTNAERASVEASNLKTILESLGGDEAILVATQKVVESDNVEVQRTAFVVITQEMETLLKGSLDSGTIYKQYCPMAFGNTGAYWLSESKYINNPYFGDKMLKCGRIDSEIK
jgi:hypothetical protein